MTLADPPTTEAVLLLTENLLGILLAGGLDPQDAAWACDIFVLLVTAAAREDDVRRPPGRGDDGNRREQAGEIYKTFAGLPPGRFPLLAAHAAQMVAGDGDERFRFAIDVVIDGVVARAARRASPLIVTLPGPGPVSSHRLMTGQAPLGAVAMIGGAGHYPHAQRPDEVAGLITGFLREHALA